MKNIFKITLGILIMITGIFIVGISKIFKDEYIIDSIWFQIDSQFFIAIIGIVIMVLGFRISSSGSSKSNTSTNGGEE